MFSKRVKHYHQWLRTAIPFKAKFGQISSDPVRVQGPSLLSKNAIERVENVKSLGFYSRLFLVPRSQSQEEAQVNTQAVVDLTQSLGWIINQEKSELKPTQVFLFMGYEYHLDSALVKPTQERWLKFQDLILRLKSKHVLTARCLMSLIGLLASTEKMVPEGRLHMRPFQFHLKEHWRYPQSLDSLLPWTEAIAAHLDWWQNPSNVMKGANFHPKEHSIQLFTDASNEGWGAHLDQNSTKGLWSDREKRSAKSGSHLM